MSTRRSRHLVSSERDARTRGRSRSRRGAGLLLVLATLLIVSSLVIHAAVSAAFTSAARRTDAALRLADSLLEPAHDAAVRWLESRSGMVVLPPDADQPCVVVLDDTFLLGTDPCSIRITAWDQLGTLPSLRRIAWDPRDTGAPSADAGARAAFDRPVVLNVRTAPLHLVDAVLRAGSRTGLQQIIDARRAGRVPLLSALSESSMSAGLAPSGEPHSDSFLSDAAPTGLRRDGPEPSDWARSAALTTDSTCWMVCVHIRVAGVTRSWWTVYVAGADGESLHTHARSAAHRAGVRESSGGTRPDSGGAPAAVEGGRAVGRGGLGASWECVFRCVASE